MDNGQLERGMIEDPQHWKLTLLVGTCSIDVAIYCPAIDNSLIYRHIQLDSANPSRCGAVEDAIYDNPLLLSDFGKVDIIIDGPDFTIIPSEASDSAPVILNEIFTDRENPSEPLTTPLPRCGATIAYLVNTDLIGFIRRSFHNCSIHHRLAPLIEYYRSRGKMGAAGKMHAHFSTGTVDLIAFGADGLTLANTFHFSHTSDAVYYIMACRHILGHDSGNELMISGNAICRDEAADILREYIEDVMPTFLPPAILRAGRDAMHAPLEMTVLPLCE